MNGIIDETDDERITYSYIGGNKRIDQCLYEGTVSANWENFIDNVTNLRLTYLDSDYTYLGDPVPNPNLSDIRTIIISMTVQEPAGREGMIDRTYATRVKCRNIGL